MKETNNKKESVVVELNSNDNNFDTTKELNRLIIASVFINKLRDFKAIYGVRNLIIKEYNCTLEQYILDRYYDLEKAKNMFSELIPFFKKEENKYIAEKKLFDEALLDKINVAYVRALSVVTNCVFDDFYELKKKVKSNKDKIKKLKSKKEVEIEMKDYKKENESLENSNSDSELPVELEVMEVASYKK